MIEVNLLPWREAQLAQERRQQWLKIVAAISLAWLLMLLLSHLLAVQIESAGLRIAHLKEQLAKIEQNWAVSKANYQAAAYQPAPTINLSFLLEQQQQLLTHLRSISQQLSAEIVLEQLSLNRQKWHLTGVSLSSVAIFYYMRRLQKNFKNVKCLELKEKEEGFSFQVLMES